MLGVIIVTHGRLAEEFRHAAEHVVGTQSKLTCVCIAPDDSLEECRERVLEHVRRTDSGQGVVILTDMFGGTPSNVSLYAMERENVEVIAGINLPMLIKLLTIREQEPLKDAALLAQEAGRKYINVVSNLLARKTDSNERP